MLVKSEGILKLTFVCLYAPNDAIPDFFDQILSTLKDFERESLIIGGDFNCVLNLKVDKRGVRLDTKPNSRSQEQSQTQAQALI